MVPIQYILSSKDIAAALASGCRWIQFTDTNFKSDSSDENPLATEIAAWLHDCHAAGSYLVLENAPTLCKTTAADGILLTPEGIAEIAAQQPKPSGIVLQQSRPVTTAIQAARAILGEDTPQFIGVYVTTPEDAIAAAKSGADYIQVPFDKHIELLSAVRERSFTTPIVANCPSIAPDEVMTILRHGISGLALSIESTAPIALPALLKADED